ncbi:hypothetical protein [Candidatus Frankia nodulisporulans]|nr:hypothetical protein [Candidatus Frankia nodulisporulans]
MSGSLSAPRFPETRFPVAGMPTDWMPTDWMPGAESPSGWTPAPRPDVVRAEADGPAGDAFPDPRAAAVDRPAAVENAPATEVLDVALVAADVDLAAAAAAATAAARVGAALG